MKIPDWKKSYKDVLFERDQSRVATTIVSAQLVMRGRLRELHRDGHDIEERKAVDAALCNIEALHRCLNFTEKRIDLAARKAGTRPGGIVAADNRRLHVLTAGQ